MRARYLACVLAALTACASATAATEGPRAYTGPGHHRNLPNVQLARARAAPGILPQQGVLAPKPTPVPVAATYPASGGPRYLTAGQVATYARRAGFPESAIPTMVAIAYRESHFCPTAVYPGHCPGTFIEGGNACSLWQLYPCPGPEAADPMAAAWFAYSKYLASGFAPWGM